MLPAKSESCFLALALPSYGQLNCVPGVQHVNLNSTKTAVGLEGGSPAAQMSQKTSEGSPKKHSYRDKEA